MAGCSVRRTHVPNDTRGIALIVALLVMGLLTLLGATFLTVASTEHTIASNELGVAKSFNIAEAGLERTKTRMKTGTEPLNNYLSGTNPGPNLYSSVAFDGGTYTVVIEDDVDTGNDPLVDTNNRVLIRATGTFGTARKQVLSLVEVVTGGGPGTIPSTRAAAESISGGSVEIHGEPGSYDGRNWTPHDLATMASCGATCGTLPDPSAAVTYGAFSNKAASFSLLNGGTMFGTGCVFPSACTSAATASKNVTVGSHTYWDNFMTAATAVADRTVGEATVGGAAGTLNWGTAAAPEVTVITDSGVGSISWAKTVNGAGVLIIDSTSNETGTAFAATGQLNWQGLVIFRAPGEIQFDSGASGKVRVFGQLVVASNTVAAQIELHNNSGNPLSFVRYSSAALTMAQQAVGGGAPSLTVRNWREVAMQ
jgi:hypothetical protein